MAPNKPNDFCSLSGRDSIWESNPGMASCLVTQPLLENLFAAFVPPFGPHMTTLTQPVFCTTAEQRSVIVDASQPFVFLPPETEAHFFLYLMCFTPRSKGLSYAGLFIIVSFFSLWHKQICFLWAGAVGIYPGGFRPSFVVFFSILLLYCFPFGQHGVPLLLGHLFRHI